MSTPAFCNKLVEEQHKIALRCEEIDENIRALESERRAIEERNEAIDAVRDLYMSSQQTVDEALSVQAQLKVSEPLETALSH